MNIRRFTIWHIVLLLILAHWGGCRATNLLQGSKETIKLIKELIRGVPAFQTLGLIRRFEIEVCLHHNYGSYKNCFPDEIIDQYNQSQEVFFHFDWVYDGGENYQLIAQRTLFDQGDPANKLFIIQENNRIKRRGEGIYWFVF